jgi:hypothetical protein
LAVLLSGPDVRWGKMMTMMMITIVYSEIRKEGEGDGK